MDIALKKYYQLAQLGSSLVSPNGTLALASCSSRVTADQFFEQAESAMAKSHSSFKLVKKIFHDIDHPISFKEGAYLKCGYYKRVR